MGIGSKLTAMAAYQVGSALAGGGNPQAPYPPQPPGSAPYPNPPPTVYPSGAPPYGATPYGGGPQPAQGQPYGGAPPPGAYLPPPFAGRGPAPPPVQYPPPNQSYSQPLGGMAAGPGTGGNSQRYRPQIRRKLEEVAQGRQLNALYPPQRLDYLADQLANTVDIEAVGRQWRLPVEVALDLVGLALYDIILYADDSYSMQGERWDSDLRMIVHRAAGVATLFDPDGISVRFMNGQSDRDNVRTEADVMALLRDAKPCGLTPIGTALRTKVLAPFLQYLRSTPDRSRLKPILVLAITDGEPQGEPHETLFNVIRETRTTLLSMGFTGNEVALEFAQVGDDAKATDFLDSLDNHPEIGRFVDATSNYEREADQWQRRSGGASAMSPDLYLVKLLCGAIDNSWDRKDDTQPFAGPPPGGYPGGPGGYPAPGPPGYGPSGPAGFQPGPPGSGYPAPGGPGYPAPGGPGYPAPGGPGYPAPGGPGYPGGPSYAPSGPGYAPPPGYPPR